MVEYLVVCCDDAVDRTTVIQGYLEKPTNIVRHANAKHVTIRLDIKIILMSFI